MDRPSRPGTVGKVPFFRSRRRLRHSAHPGGKRLVPSRLAGMARLSSALGSVLPRLVLAQIMSDLRTDLSTQARMFGAFDADIKGAVKEGLGEGVKSAVEALEMYDLPSGRAQPVRESE